MVDSKENYKLGLGVKELIFELQRSESNSHCWLLFASHSIGEENLSLNKDNSLGMKSFFFLVTCFHVMMYQFCKENKLVDCFQELIVTEQPQFYDFQICPYKCWCFVHILHKLSKD